MLILAEKDSLLYNSGENLYMTAKYDKGNRTCSKNTSMNFPTEVSDRMHNITLLNASETPVSKDEALKLYMEVTRIRTTRLLNNL